MGEDPDGNTCCRDYGHSVLQFASALLGVDLNFKLGGLYFEESRRTSKSGPTLRAELPGWDDFSIT